jgi:hypothetical protein
MFYDLQTLSRIVIVLCIKYLETEKKLDIDHFVL